MHKCKGWGQVGVFRCVCKGFIEIMFWQDVQFVHPAIFLKIRLCKRYFMKYNGKEIRMGDKIIVEAVV